MNPRAGALHKLEHVMSSTDVGNQTEHKASSFPVEKHHHKQCLSSPLKAINPFHDIYIIAKN